MTRLAPAITLVAAIVMALFGYAFYPWAGNLLGEAGWLSIPLWAGCAALALGLAAVTAHLLRQPRPRG